MTIDESIKTASSGVGLAVELIKAAGDSPSGKEAAGNLGQTAVTLTKTINNILLPIAAVNFAFEKARIYFSKKFEDDISEKTKSIPVDQLIEPKGSIAGPVLQGLAFSHDEKNLKDMYLSLLASSMDKSTATRAHPAFVEIIKQLDSSEAGLLRAVLRSHQLSIIQIQVSIDPIQNQGYHIALNHVLDLVDDETGLSEVNQNLPMMVYNWIRLGLIEVDYDRRLASPDSYNWINSRPEITELKEQHEKNGAYLSYKNGVLSATDLGVQFAVAVGMYG